MNILDYIIFSFSEKELSIYRMRRFGRKTLEEVGKEFGVTRERVRQIESKVEEKTRIMKLNVEIEVENKLEIIADELSERTKLELRNHNLLT